MLQREVGDKADTGCKMRQLLPDASRHDRYHYDIDDCENCIDITPYGEVIIIFSFAEIGNGYA